MIRASAAPRAPGKWFAFLRTNCVSWILIIPFASGGRRASLSYVPLWKCRRGRRAKLAGTAAKLHLATENSSVETALVKLMLFFGFVFNESIFKNSRWNFSSLPFHLCNIQFFCPPPRHAIGGSQDTCWGARERVSPPASPLHPQKPGLFLHPALNVLGGGKNEACSRNGNGLGGGLAGGGDGGGWGGCVNEKGQQMWVTVWWNTCSGSPAVSTLRWASVRACVCVQPVRNRTVQACVCVCPWVSGRGYFLSGCCERLNNQTCSSCYVPTPLSRSLFYRQFVSELNLIKQKKIPYYPSWLQSCGNSSRIHFFPWL